MADVNPQAGPEQQPQAPQAAPEAQAPTVEELQAKTTEMSQTLATRTQGMQEKLTKLESGSEKSTQLNALIEKALALQKQLAAFAKMQAADVNPNSVAFFIDEATKLEAEIANYEQAEIASTAPAPTAPGLAAQATATMENAAPEAEVAQAAQPPTEPLAATTPEPPATPEQTPTTTATAGTPVTREQIEADPTVAITSEENLPADMTSAEREDVGEAAAAALLTEEPLQKPTEQPAPTTSEAKPAELPEQELEPHQAAAAKIDIQVPSIGEITSGSQATIDAASADTSVATPAPTVGTDIDTTTPQSTTANIPQNTPKEVNTGISTKPPAQAQTTRGTADFAPVAPDALMTERPEDSNTPAPGETPATQNAEATPEEVSGVPENEQGSAE